ncbi:nuclear transport factor 2 family protein [Sinorhizobium numidicum]|uniref:Nuclear transport factor 2 family protein n=1 Tax=Sinorhizobium numidicum TaxID=680248 RepID=A0ABY8D298_9HYPH|nr:ketosteroid isomerase-related protein [Sinorhizobium numidicum]WEX76467.1 nuclear transport factor 2 family protein [Sinorhizobium numidicum]WEX83128.1 nuclear transport factor 2 family protein [Sinorhizobium numidicum]
MTDAQTIASRFIEALNDRDFDALSTLVDEDVALDSVTGQRTVGVGPLRAWVMSYLRHFDETFSDVVLMHDAFGQRVAADMTARGTYRETMTGFPEASGQSYSIPSVFIFEIEDGAITRLSHYRNIRIFEQELAG